MHNNAFYTCINTTLGDVAVGRISRVDVSKVIVKTLYEPSSVLKTFECFTLLSYPSSPDIKMQMERLMTDEALSNASEDSLYATYSLLQQLVPGEKQQPNLLAAGQTYEELDQNKTGRLGVRGEEVVPIEYSN